MMNVREFSYVKREEKVGEEREGENIWMKSLACWRYFISLLLRYARTASSIHSSLHLSSPHPDPEPLSLLPAP